MTGKSKDTHLLASIKAFLRRNIPSIYLPIAIWWNKILKRERLKSKLLQKYTTLNGWEVRHGPFTGMLLTEYSRERLPILIGSYEDEIQAWVREIIKTKYDHIVNIGSGTGYYAIGLALQMPWVSITAFEADISVQEIFRRNVELNGVERQIHIKGLCDPAELRSLLREIAGQYCLIICDCEGCEFDLLNPLEIPALRENDLLIEFHLHKLGEKMSTMLQTFSASHDISLITAQKKQPQKYPDIASWKSLEQEVALLERWPRHGAWKWGYLVSKQQVPRRHTPVEK